LFRTARVLHPYRDPEEIIEFLRAATAGEPIKCGEIERAVRRSVPAASKAGQSPQNALRIPAWPKVNHEQREAVVASGGSLVDLWEASPARFQDNESRTEDIIDALFPGDPLLCTGRSNCEFDTRSREEWRGRLSALQLIVPNPMTARIGRTQEGKLSAHALETTGPRRFLVIEQDTGTRLMNKQRYCCIWQSGRHSRWRSIVAGNQFMAGSIASGNRKKNCGLLCNMP
jgi:hypothetical protein